MARILVDADGLLYLAGFGVEDKQWEVFYEDETGDPTVSWFDTAHEVNAFFKENEQFAEIERVAHIDVGPLSHACQIIKTKLDLVKQQYPRLPMEVYARHPEQRNFREQIATLAPYKGNRSSIKPTHYDDLLAYLQDNYRAYLVMNQEVDDEIGCRLTELNDNAIIVSPDKDLDQLPGEHYSYKTMTSYRIYPDEAREWFWTQVLTGDSADNVKGVWRLGKVGAREIIQAVHHMDDEDVWETVVQVYAASQEKPSCPYVGLDPSLVALENAQLVYMRRYRNEIWMPPGTPNLMEDYKW